MKVLRAVVGALLCFAPSLSYSDSSKIEYTCYYVNGDGEVADHGYAISLWFDASVTVKRFSQNRSGYAMSCEFDIFGDTANELRFTCRTGSPALLTIVIYKETLKGWARRGESFTFDLTCKKD